MQICRSLAFSLSLLTAVSGFVGPQISSSTTSRTQLAAASDDSNTGDIIKGLAFSALFGLAMVVNPLPSLADGQTGKFKLPPIDATDKNRCKIVSSAMGQSNGARDKLFDLRQCSLPGSKAAGFDLSGVIMTDTDLSGSNFKEAYFSKGYMQESNFENTDFSNAIVDRASFKGSSLKGAIFNNAVLTGTSFESANVENADFSDAYIGDFDIRALCRNPTLKGENPTTGMDTRMSVGCK